jgi:ABC-type cobalt transport system substrate-binding protein
VFASAASLVSRRTRLVSTTIISFLFSLVLFLVVLVVAVVLVFVVPMFFAEKGSYGGED